MAKKKSTAPPAPYFFQDLSSNLAGKNAQDYAGWLSTLYGNSYWKNYGVYFLMPAIGFDGVLQKYDPGLTFMNIAGAAFGEPNAPYPQHLYNGKPVLTVQAMTNLYEVPAFRIADHDKVVFVNLDSAPFPRALVPYDSAKLISLCFIMGLVNRWILDCYCNTNTAAFSGVTLAFDALNPPPADWIPPFIGPAPTNSRTNASKPINPGDAVDDFWTVNLRSFVSTVAKPATWTADFNSCLASATPASLQAAAVLMGWRAGDRLLSRKSRQYDPACLQAIQKLIGYSYSFRDIGKMMGYVTMLLQGYAKNINTELSVLGKATTTVPHQGDIFNRLVQQQNLQCGQIINFDDSVDNLASRIAKLIGGELAMVALAGPFSYVPKSQPQTYLVQVVGMFLQGFTEGMIKAANTLFQEFFQEGFHEGYTIGYSQGFREGYGQGYASGWQAGYSSGANAQSSAFGLLSILNSVGTAVDNVSAILDNPAAGAAISFVASAFF